MRPGELDWRLAKVSGAGRDEETKLLSDLGVTTAAGQPELFVPQGRGTGVWQALAAFRASVFPKRWGLLFFLRREETPLRRRRLLDFWVSSIPHATRCSNELAARSCRLPDRAYALYAQRSSLDSNRRCDALAAPLGSDGALALLSCLELAYVVPVHTHSSSQLTHLHPWQLVSAGPLALEAERPVGKAKELAIISGEEVQKHVSPGSAWVVIDGVVLE